MHSVKLSIFVIATVFLVIACSSPQAIDTYSQSPTIMDSVIDSASSATPTGPKDLRPDISISATPSRTIPNCTVRVERLNLRRGPGTAYDPPIATLIQGTELRMLGRNSDSTWIQVRTVDDNLQGWVSANERFIDCNTSVINLRFVSEPPTPTARISSSRSTPLPGSNLAVTLITPDDNYVGGGRIQFNWSADFALSQDQAFEVVFWRPDADPFRESFGFGTSTNTTFSVDLDSIYHLPDHPLTEGTYKWGVLLVNTNPYSRIQYLGGERFLTFRPASIATTGAYFAYPPNVAQLRILIGLLIVGCLLGSSLVLSDDVVPSEVKTSDS